MADPQAITHQQNGNGTARTAEPVPTPELPAEEDIRRTRAEISQTTTLIQQQLRANMSWRLWVYRYPLAMTTLAAAAGVAAGFALPGGARDSTRRSSATDADGPQPNRREERLIKETGQTTLVATVLTNLATMALREGSRYLAQRFFDGAPERR
ncbi:hypothetical protein [Gloeobacter morelensis]|uniref:DUF3618 domain-containing protein n=1 Tax=Gloeobacter morelensis MG652769 TaxID=2781736 RepID=A0ABY3PKP2_9CYAN|nr:hypothetical protein [Gloeobacter morelensis]UFP94235.1 hypothetical protein ISF26_21170 [Gloeobacter morelensis MG652769]